MANKDNLLQCYNRGCGQKYDPANNTDESCRHHPGTPVFHDAYKGWSCCNKKCTDFTEFLNIKGCTLSKHSSIKPIEPEVQQKPVPDGDIVEVRPPERVAMKRPPVDTPLVTLTPQIAPSLRQQLQSIKVVEENKSGEIPMGTTCKNGGCNVSYEGPKTDDVPCIYHPGIPVFHEGLKFWSCCQKRTTDFNAFLNQVGCEHGKHVWKSENEESKSVQCRWDFHQTGSFVIVSVYAKKYSPDASVVKLNPVRLYVSLVFPENGNATFEMDNELFGIVDVAASELSMYGTKVEIKLKKAEPVSWRKLEIRKVNETVSKPPEEAPSQNMKNLTHLVKDVDLSDL